MLAVIEKNQEGYVARFERHLKFPVEQVWSALTENDKLSKWFSELSIEDLKEGGKIKFDFGDGTFEELEIIEVKKYSVLEYTWGEDRVRFELFHEPEGCRLVLIEKIKNITDQTSKDLAGWHVCLSVINALLSGNTYDQREDEWKVWAEKYEQLTQGISEK
ncbi:hypothetical protein OXPF_29830 [Oxobacter pfennigii]|uniref:Activator of Hsp90 ATPase homologue 1/2-like C-terminal domain-containing protein n=1 Tax=Oxobacter pfennigii TaxID=36849 RepID=A0A0P8WYP2_9CLOT|nr:SRPBCC family protein [Oxobacter pfennigii]KPU43542.1 hypothetical protein OXPF_29830 [Oxobacter pfennigii]